MKPITKSRNEREGRYAGRRRRSTIEFHRYNWIRPPGTRHFRTGPDDRNESLRERIPPGGWYGDPLGGGWGDE